MHHHWGCASIYRPLSRFIFGIFRDKTMDEKLICLPSIIISMEIKIKIIGGKVWTLLVISNPLWCKNWFLRCWTRITSDLVGLELGEEIPDTDPYFLEYGPDFTLAVTPTNIKNSNSKKDIEDLVALVKDNLEKIVL